MKKREFFSCPKEVQPELFGFSWMEYVLAIPSPLVLVTSYKENGLPNAAMQSWCTFTGNEGYHCLFSCVHKAEHMYSSVLATKHFVVNFPSKDVFIRCMRTIKNNEYETDEITASGLTVIPAKLVNAPMVKECFLNLECEFEWEKELVPDGDHVVMCGKIVGFSMDEEYYDAQKKGRYGENGYLYNIHCPTNPETGKTEKTQIGVIKEYATYTAKQIRCHPENETRIRFNK